MTIHDLPDYAQKAIEVVLKKHPEYNTPDGAWGECVTATDELLFACDIIADKIVDGFMTGTDEPEHHHWAVIEGICVDLTAKQFNPHEPCPKIWKHVPEPSELIESEPKNRKVHHYLKYRINEMINNYYKR